MYSKYSNNMNCQLTTHGRFQLLKYDVILTVHRR